MLLKLDRVSKHYHLGDTLIRALDKVTLNIDEGELVAIMGPSGSGKSTFLHVASMLAEPTQGRIFLKNLDVTEHDEAARASLRNAEIGFIFQQFNLLAKTSSQDNVALPLVYAHVNTRERERRSKEMLERVGLGERLKNTPSQLSGGQQQRVAIARALINNPSIIFADEPTGNLDSKSGTEIINLLQELNREGKTIIIVTHEESVAKIAKRLIHFEDGHVVSDEKVSERKVSGGKVNNNKNALSRRISKQKKAKS
jgi:putative ABC transport system ATP-binding protein